MAESKKPSKKAEGYEEEIENTSSIEWLLRQTLPKGDPNNIRKLKVEPLTDEDYEEMIAEIRRRKMASDKD